MPVPDPFGGQAAQAAPEEAQQQTPPSDPWQSAPAAPTAPAPVVVARGEGKIVMTFKEGTGFESTWNVVHADSVADARAILVDPAFKELLELQRHGAAFFRGGSAVSSGGAPAAQRESAPSGALQPPPGSPASPGPGWGYKTGSKNGRVWHGWFPPYAQKDSLKPEFFDPPK